MQGREYCCGSLQGGPGDSFRVNVQTGKWADFAIEGSKGGDLVSLYAAINNLSQGDAARKLASQANYKLESDQPQEPVEPPAQAEELPSIPPEDAAQPNFGSPSTVWPYKDSTGRLLFYVARYETSTGKEYHPFSWIGGQWRRKSWQAPRPLYGLDRLASYPDKPVVVCEGEKSADAATAIMGTLYIAVCWPNGAQAIGKADFSPLYGRKILLWPDNDEPGHKAMVALASILHPHCPELKLIDPSGMADKWDAADALKEGWAYKDLINWVKAGREEGKSRAYLYTDMIKPKPEPEPEPEPEKPALTLDAPTESQLINPHSLGLQVNSNGRIHNNMDNVMRVLEKITFLKGKIWWDSFLKRIITTLWCEPGVPKREWENHDTLKLLRFFQRELCLPDTKELTIWQALDNYAHSDVRNEPKQWMESLKWDGIERLKDFCSKYLAVVPSGFASKTGKNFMVSLVARIFDPGCKVDTMPVLEGGEGRRKSTSFAILGGPWYYDCVMDINSKVDFEESLQGKWLVEFS